MSIWRAAILIGLTLATLAGCDGPEKKTGGEPYVIRPTPYASPETAQNLYRLQLYYITERLGLG